MTHFPQEHLELLAESELLAEGLHCPPESHGAHLSHPGLTWSHQGNSMA